MFAAIESRSDTDPVLRLDLTGLTADSRQVEPGFLFAALPGTAKDGREFVPEAVQRGAIAVLRAPGALPEPLPDGVMDVQDDNPRRRFAQLCAAFYERQPRTIAAITGTNGKTSTAEFTRQIWQRLGHDAASLGTLGVIGPGFDKPLALTTPDPVSLHRNLARLAANGVDHLAIEASSHGLSQYRLDGLRLKAGAFTSFSRDHLDYHSTVKEYLDAKLRLFEELLPPGSAVLVNADDPASELVAAACRRRHHQTVTYGRGGVWLRLDSIETEDHGQLLNIEAFGRSYRIRLPLVGAFQASNALCAAGLAIATGAEAGDAIHTLEALEGVRGRLQMVARTPAGAPIFVDYAHTPDALANALSALRPHTRGKLVVVFGAGGDRDRGKRPLMGEVAARQADAVIVTDDNPRSESPAAIRWSILAACPGAQEIGDRAQAITAAVRHLGANDALLIAGKGHERGQTIRGRVIPFDDAEVARAAVQASTGAREAS